MEHELLGLLEEFKRRKHHTFATYSPLDLPEIDQLAYHKSTAWCRLVFGGNRSGKSRVSAQEILWASTESHPYQDTPKKPRTWVVAPEYRVIYEGIWGHLRDNIPDWELKKFGVKIPQWDIPSYIEFKNGARVDFISAEGGETDRKKLQAAEVDYIFIDEEISGDLRDEIMARLITRGGRLNISATLVTSEQWLLELEQQGEDPDNSDVSLFRFNTTKNPYNNEQALNRWMKQLSPEEKEIRIYGRSRKLRGLIYRVTSAHKISPFDLPKAWPRIHVFDPGHRVAAALWFALSPDRHIYLYREMYLLYTSLSECAKFFRAAEGWQLISGAYIRNEFTEDPYIRLIDPSAFNIPQDGSISTADQMLEHYGYEFIPAINTKNQNIEDVRRLLIPEENPIIKIYETLENFWMEVRKYRIKERKTKPNADEVVARPLKKDDHLMNCWEYFASQRLVYEAPDTAQTELQMEAEKTDDEIEFPDDPTEYRNKRLSIALIRRRNKFRERSSSSFERY